MAIATTAEREKKQEDLDKHLKKLADPVTGQQKIPPLLTMVRGAIRSSWAISPIKLAYWEKGRVADEDPTTLTKWKMQCECCNLWFKCDEIEIDHRSGNHTFTKVDDFSTYFDNILDVQFNDLQRICKYKCHRVKSHMEKQKLPSMKFAAMDKITIFLIKAFDKVELSRVLSGLGITPDSTSAKRRRDQLYQWVVDLGWEEEYYMKFFETCDYIMRLEAKRKKAKRFKLTKRDIIHIIRWNNFWSKKEVLPKTTFKVLHLDLH